ncbi:hypothetical protein DRN73_03980 [Candidatus Pacearchaeota archaeon]|nr:MAG: hypothetical protein DRN73_03980 [Candidatus Pacearchaeota archaeon]
MKRAVIILILILGLFSSTNFASAQEHFCQQGDSNIHGVYIDGECFNCDNVTRDDVCPDDYGEIVCSVIPDIDCGPQAPEAFWSLDNVTSTDSVTVLLPNGKYIYMIVKNTDLPDDTEITFNIKEEKTGVDTLIANATANISGGKAIGIWKITEDEINKITNLNNLIYFKASANGWSGLTSEPKLNITTTYSSGVGACGDYNNPNDCDLNPYGVGYSIGAWAVSGDCERRINKTGCSWENGQCTQNTTIEYRGENCANSGVISSCSYTEGNRLGDCNAGDDYFQINYVSSQPGCDDFKSDYIPCPAQIKLGFFGLFNIISSLILISLIYFMLSKKESL